MAKNTLITWGEGGIGRAGGGYEVGESGHFPFPQKVLTLEEVKQISCYLGGSFALKIDGSVYGWGSNGFGPLGLGDRQNRIEPTQLTSLGTEVKALSSMADNACAILKSGEVKGWGSNPNGTDGTGDESVRWLPTFVETSEGVRLKEIKAASNSYRGCMYLNEKGEIYRSGSKDLQGEHKYATKIELPEIVNVKAIASSYHFTLVLLEDGSIRTWGRNVDGYLGIGTEKEAEESKHVNEVHNPLPGVKNVIAVSVSTYHALALLSTGKVMAWGKNSKGQLGFSSGGKNVTTPTEIPGLEKVKAIVAAGTEQGSGQVGGQFSLFLLENGTVKGCGENEQGELADGTKENRETPVSMIGGFTNVEEISASEGHALARLKEETLPERCITGVAGKHTVTVNWKKIPGDRIESWTVEWARRENAPSYNAFGTLVKESRIVTFSELPEPWGESVFGEGVPISDADGFIPKGTTLVKLRPELGVHVWEMSAAATETVVIPEELNIGGGGPEAYHKVNSGAEKSINLEPSVSTYTAKGFPLKALWPNATPEIEIVVKSNYNVANPKATVEKGELGDGKVKITWALEKGGTGEEEPGWYAEWRPIGSKSAYTQSPLLPEGTTSYEVMGLASEEIEAKVKGSYETFWKRRAVFVLPEEEKSVPYNVHPPFVEIKAEKIRPRIGETVKVVPGTWEAASSGAVTERFYQWVRDGSNEIIPPEVIKGATGTSYTIQREDVGFYIRCNEIVKNAEGFGTRASLSEMSREVPSLVSLSGTDVSSAKLSGNLFIPTVIKNSLLIGDETKNYENAESVTSKHVLAVKFTAVETGLLELLKFRTAKTKNTGITKVVWGVSTYNVSTEKPGTVLGEGTTLGEPGIEQTIVAENIKTSEGKYIEIVKGNNYFLEALPIGGTLHFNTAVTEKGTPYRKSSAEVETLAAATTWGGALSKGPIGFFGVAIVLKGTAEGRAKLEGSIKLIAELKASNVKAKASVFGPLRTRPQLKIKEASAVGKLEGKLGIRGKFDLGEANEKINARLLGNIKLRLLLPSTSLSTHASALLPLSVDTASSEIKARARLLAELNVRGKGKEKNKFFALGFPTAIVAQPMLRRVPTADWRWKLVNSSNLGLITELNGAHARKLQLILNQPGIATCWLHLLDEDTAYVQEHKTSLLLERNNKIIWSGPVYKTDEVSNATTDQLQITAMGWFQNLNKRILHTGDEFKSMIERIGHKPEDGFYVPLGEESAIQLAYHNTPGARIVSDLVNRANIDWTTSIEMGPIPETNGLNLTLHQFVNIGEQITRLANVEDGFDFIIDPSTRKLIIERNAIRGSITGKGVDRGKGTLFTYPGNCIEAHRSRDGTKTRNRMEISGPYGVGKSEEVQSKQENGLFEENISVPEVTHTELLIAIAGIEVYTLKEPFQIVTISPKPVSSEDSLISTVPRPFDDYELGDIVYTRIEKGPRFRVGITNPQPIRVYSMTVEIEDSGVEKISNIQTTYTQ